MYVGNLIKIIKHPKVHLQGLKSGIVPGVLNNVSDNILFQQKSFVGICFK